MLNDWNGIGMTSNDVPDEIAAAGNGHCGECREAHIIDARDASRNMAQAWQSISDALPEFYFMALWQMVHEAVTNETTTVNLSKSVCELATYIKLTGEVPADPFVFFDFNK